MADERAAGRPLHPFLPPLIGLTIVATVFGLVLFGPEGAVSLPGAFMALATVALLGGLGALWQSLRSVLGGGPDVDAGGIALPERDALLEEKETLLQAIRDITFDHRVGKIGEEDFNRLNRSYRARAKEVLRLLDQDLGPFMERAEALLDEATGGRATKRRRKKVKGQVCGECGARNDLDARFCKECATPLGEVRCPSCGTENDPDAKFCKECASSLKGDGGRAKPTKAKKKNKKRKKAKAEVAAETESETETETELETETESESESETDAEPEDDEPEDERASSEEEE